MLMPPYCGQKPYDTNDVVFLRNPEQSARFAKYIYLYDTILSGDKFVYVFNKKDAEPLFALWRDHELK